MVCDNGSPLPLLSPDAVPDRRCRFAASMAARPTNLPLPAVRPSSGVPVPSSPAAACGRLRPPRRRDGRGDFDRGCGVASAGSSTAAGMTPAARTGITSDSGLIWAGNSNSEPLDARGSATSSPDSTRFLYASISRRRRAISARRTLNSSGSPATSSTTADRGTAGGPGSPLAFPGSARRTGCWRRAAEDGFGAGWRWLRVAPPDDVAFARDCCRRARSRRRSWIAFCREAMAARGSRAGRRSADGATPLDGS